MVCSIDRRTHQIYRAGIHTDIIFVGVLFMDCLCYQASVRRKHKTSHLCIDRNISHSGRNQDLLVYFPYTLSDHTDIIRCLIRFVGNTDSAGKIDKADRAACFLTDLKHQFKQCARQCRIIIICNRVAYEECVDTKTLCSFFF